MTPLDVAKQEGHTETAAYLADIMQARDDLGPLFSYRKTEIARNNLEMPKPEQELATHHETKVEINGLEPTIADSIDGLFEENDAAIYAALEGKEELHTRLERQRDGQLPKIKKATVLRKTGSLQCQGCGFDFYRVYGERGRYFIECHHTTPISELTEERETTLEDLALLCANCHRMVHKARPWLTIEQLQQLIENNRQTLRAK